MFSIIQENMPSYRGLRVNWKKPFKLCEEKTKFDQMEPTDKTFPTFAPSPTKHPDELTRQKQLHPQIKVVVPLVNPKKCSDFSAKYIRSHHNIQTAFETEYQLSQDDWKFLKNHQQQLKIDDQPIFNDHLLKQVIIFLEKKAKLGSQPKLKSKWLLPFIKKGPKEIEKYININKIEQLLLSYWKRRRQAFIFPLYRPLWKNLNKQDLLFVYRPRGKKHVEKLTELDEESLTEQLCQQIEQTSMICQGFRARQLVKLKKTKKRIEQFEDWAKIYISQQELNNILGDGQLVAQRLTNIDQKAMNQTSQCVNKYFAKDRDIVSEQCTCQSYQSVPTSLAPQKLQKKKNILASIIPEISVENSSQQKSEDFWESIHGLRKEKAQAKQSQNVSAHEASQ